MERRQQLPARLGMQGCRAASGIECERAPARALCRRSLLVTLFLSLWAHVAVSTGQEPTSPEERAARIKAAYLFQLLGYVEWPEASFPTNESPFVVCVCGDSPVDAVLATIAKTKQVKGRRITVGKYQPGDLPAHIHLLYVTKGAVNELRMGVVDVPSASPVLVVGEDRECFAHGAVINLLEVDNKVRLHLSLNAARSRQLRISSKLSSVSTLVDP